MALVRNAARIARATELRNLAVDLVALGGAMTDAQAGNKNIQVMMYENDRLAVLYKTPRLDLSTEGAPAWIQPKGFMVDVWFDGRKTMSIQWDHEGPIDVFTFTGRMGGFDHKCAFGNLIRRLGSVVALLNHRIIMLNMGVPPDNSLSKKGIAGMLKDGWDELDRKVDIELAVPPVLRRTRNIFIVLFALGQFLPLSAPTYRSATSPQPSPS